MIINKIPYGDQKSHFSSKPNLAQGGFTLDTENQSFKVGDVISAGSLAVMNDETRKIQIVKTAKVTEIEEDGRTLYLKDFPYNDPCFSPGERILRADHISGSFSEAPEILSVKASGLYSIVLSEPVPGLAVGDVIQQVVNRSGMAAEIGKANSVTVRDVELIYLDDAIDVAISTGIGQLREQLIPPVPGSQKDSTGSFLEGNTHISLTKVLI